MLLTPITNLDYHQLIMMYTHTGILLSTNYTHNSHTQPTKCNIKISKLGRVTIWDS